MLSCARATRGLRRPSHGLVARLGVPVGGRVRKLRAVGDHLARPQGRRLKSGGRSKCAVGNLPGLPVSLVPHVSYVSRQRNYARSEGAPRPLPSISSPTHLIPIAKIECIGFLSKTWRKAGWFQAESRRLSVINSVGCLHRQFSVSSLEWAHAVRVGS
jgi:hypothetical protein